MDEVGRLYYERGRRYFELGKYDEAVSDLIQAYELDYEKESILVDIYNCFILPNEEEFRGNYKKSSSEFTQLTYEECVLDFIPVSQDKFYIFDKEEGKFRGEILLPKEPLRGKKVEFSDILYADVWDVRLMMPDMEENNRDFIYVVLNQLEAKFISFLKLPCFKKIYLENVKVFKDDVSMCDYFGRHEEVYLPRQIIAIDVQRYWKIINILHEERVHHIGAVRNNIFLSICIPSYNRGKLALENVRHILSCVYDSEIEIVLSNNGSVGGYDDFKNIEDSRFRYHEFAENQGYAANILKVCELAKGKYAIIISDEDWVILDNLGEYLKYIKSYPECGVYHSDVKGKELYEEDYFIKAGIEAVKMVSTWTAVSGITYNMQLCRRLGVVESLNKMRCGYPVDWRNKHDMLSSDEGRNLFLEVYTHECISLVLAYYANVAVTKLMFLDSEWHGIQVDPGFLVSCQPNSRIETQKGFLRLCHKMLELSKEEFIFLFLDKCKRIHKLIHIAFLFYWKEMFEFGSEWEVHRWIYQEQLKYLKAFPIPLTEEEYKQVEADISKIEGLL